MKAYVTTPSMSGLGDQYAGILSAYNLFLYLNSLGYDTHIHFYGNNPHYFRLHSVGSLDPLFDLSPFNGKVLYNRMEEIEKECISLPQVQNSLKIHVSSLVKELDNYEAQVYDFNHFAHERHFIPPSFTQQFLNADVLKIKNRFLGDKDKFTWLHVRISDGDRLKSVEELYRIETRLAQADEYIANHRNETILVGSNVSGISDHFSSIYANVIHNKLTDNLGNYYLNENIPVDKLILHAQEVAAEMALIAHANKIIRVTAWPSSFLTYGVMHNIHYTDWYTKRNSLFTHLICQ